ncbi:hypothetical protein CKAH01_10877 [Colletotrichum kahawae]|uniref:Uncharacterized protein n=1 Tax=Colletotrichum kahawae TaxID=34407 RepID=A0AAE0CWP1_COLKA|nr:hypothetical protein CKAH01_10877 [Colletotrichum kahawae]
MTVVEQRKTEAQHWNLVPAFPITRMLKTAGNTARLFLKNEPCDHRVLAEPDSYHAIVASHHETSDYGFQNLRD